MNKEQFQTEIGELLENVIPPETLPLVIDKLTELGESIRNKTKKASANRTVKEFHEKFNADIDQPITTERIKHRLNLMFEELAEFADAGGTIVQIHFDNLMKAQVAELQPTINRYFSDNEGSGPDPKEMLDALADLAYVTAGTNIAFGFHRIFDDAFAVVHSNNMTKLHKGKVAVVETENYLIEQGEYNPELFKYQAVDMKDEVVYYLVTYKDKVMKPRDHTKVSLDNVIDEWERKMDTLHNSLNFLKEENKQ